VFISLEANVSEAYVKRTQARGRKLNEHRTRQAIRGIKEMFRKDGLLPKAAA
jgi:hypothetical protein